MSLRKNDTIPDLKVETDQGALSLHEWIGVSVDSAEDHWN